MYSIISRASRGLYLPSISLKHFRRQLYDYFNNSGAFVEQKPVSFTRGKLHSLKSAPTFSLPTSSLSTSNQCVYLTAKKVKEYLSNYDTILLDCDGVLWGTDHTTRIQNIGRALKKLRDCGKRLLFVTNNSLHSRETFLEKFKSFGYEDVCEDELFCVNSASALYLKEVLNIKGSVYLIGNREMDKELRAVGIDCFGVGPDPDPVTHEKAKMLKANFRDDVEAVLVGFDKHINYNKLYKAASYLKSQSQCHYLATSNVETGTWIGVSHFRPATGVIVNCVTAACGRVPKIIGKPSPFLYDCIQMRFPNIKNTRTIMIGDSLKSDITFAQNVGIDSGLVLSGATDFSALSSVDYEKKPTFYFESIGLFAEAL